MAMKRICIVGLGSIGRRHLRLLSERDDVTLELVDTNLNSLNNIYNEFGTYYTHCSFDAMLETKPDIVVISTPHFLHSQQTVKALENNIDVFCEKPMSINLSDAVEMAKAAKKTGRLLNIGFQLHFHPAIKALKNIIQEGELGNILHFHCRVGTYITLLNSMSRYQVNEKGALIFDYCHQTDLLYWILEKIPLKVYVSALQAGELEMTSDPNIALLSFEYREPLLSTIHLNYIQFPERHEYEVIGDKGWALLDANEGILKVGMRDTGKISCLKFDTNRDELYRNEWNAFFDAMEGKKAVESPAEKALISVALCEGAFKAWKSKSMFSFNQQELESFSMHAIGKFDD